VEAQDHTHLLTLWALLLVLDNFLAEITTTLAAAVAKVKTPAALLDSVVVDKVELANLQFQEMRVLLAQVAVLVLVQIHLHHTVEIMVVLVSLLLDTQRHKGIIKWLKIMFS